MDKLASKFKAHYDEVEARIDKIQEENKELQKELTTLKSAQAKDKFNTLSQKTFVKLYTKKTSLRRCLFINF